MSARVLCVDDDRDVAEVVQAVLTDEGYNVSCLYEASGDTLARTVGMIEPDCVLLDGGGHTEYGEGWLEAAALHGRQRPVPVIMFTAHQTDAAEGAEGASDRAREAHFAAVLPKPFQLDELLAAVAAAVGQSAPFERGDAAETRRTEEFVEALQRAGATDIQPSTMREWATFRDPSGALVQIYWWQGRGVYQVGRYTADGTLRMVGQLTDRDAAIELAMLPSG